MAQNVFVNKLYQFLILSLPVKTVLRLVAKNNVKHIVQDFRLNTTLLQVMLPRLDASVTAMRSCEWCKLHSIAKTKLHSGNWDQRELDIQR